MVFSRLKSKIKKYTTSKGDPKLGPESTANLEAIDAYIQQHIGPIDFVYHEIASDYVHVDVHHVPPDKNRPFHVLVTSGMSDKPMKAPKAGARWKYSELLLLLPESWPLSEDVLADEENYWSLHELKRLARFPHQYNTWLSHGHTIANGDPAEPFAKTTKLCNSMLYESMSFPDLHPLEVARKEIFFWTVYPLYSEEVEFKLQHGSEVLMSRFVELGINDVIDPSRRSVVPKQ